MSDSPIIFDRKTVCRHRDRAASSIGGHPLLAEIGERLCDRLADFTRPFPLALDLGAHDGVMGDTLAGRGGIQVMVQADLSQAMLEETNGYRVVTDEEFLPFADNTFDVVLSAWSLHWVNDLPGTLIQIRRMLKNDGLFLAVMPGGQTLKELRAAFEQAEMTITGGISPRVSPFIDVRGAGALLQRAGFAMPVADSEILIAEYDSPLELLTDLRDMGETNALIARQKHFTRRSVLLSAMDLYTDLFSVNGSVPTTFELVTLTGWKNS
jgi:NADH dehydrogenase [ubiquinone] 1 alpha subcomplex assembly factor 5